MRTVHKYALTEPTNKVSTFEGARFIHVANQREQVTVWAEVNTMERECLANLHIVGTGGEVPSGGRFVGSALMASGNLVFHVYAEPVTSPTSTDGGDQ